MKISLSKPKEGERRHVVMSMTRSESAEAHHLIISGVLQNSARPVRQQSKRQPGVVRYRFHMRYLDRILLTFPMAEMSEALQRRLIKIARKEIEQANVPEWEPPFTSDVELYGYQKIGSHKVWEALSDEDSPRWMLNDEMGLGKTLQTLGALLMGDWFPVLVVCPSSGKYVWKNEIERHTGLECVVAEGAAAERRVALEKRADVTIINYEMLRGTWEGKGDSKKWVPKFPELFDFEYEVFVYDEFHRVKNPTAQQTQGFFQIKARREVGLSGTPMLNRPEEVWPTLHRQYPERFPNFYMFERALTIKSAGRFKKTVGYHTEAMAELKEFLAHHSTRRRKDQVLRDLPAKQYSRVLVELTAEQRRLYNELRDNFLMWLDDGTKKSVATVLAQLTRLKQACFSPELYEGSKHSAKLTELKEIVRELVDSNEKAIIVSQWSTATRIIERELKSYNPAYVDGTVPPGKKRQAQADKFNNDKDCHVYIGTIGANRESINLGSASYVIFTDKAWTPMDNEQAIGRSAAGGLRGLNAKTNKVNIIELFAEDTVEARIEDMLANKTGLFNALIEKDGGAAVNRITVQEIRDLL